MTLSIGFIGTGSLGSMLIRGFIEEEAVSPEAVYIYNRTQSKAEKLKEEYSQLRVAENNREVISHADWIFLCVKPGDFPQLLAEIGTEFTDDKIIISTLLSPPLSELDKIIKGKVARIYPSITQSTGHGVAMAAFNQKITKNERQQITNFLNHIGTTVSVPEKLFRACGDITSCGPAFMAYMVGSLAQEAQKHGVDKNLAETMAKETMLGTILFLNRHNLSFEELIKQVATPGGCTAKGVNELSEVLPDAIEKVFAATEAKEKDVCAQVLLNLDR